MRFGFSSRIFSHRKSFFQQGLELETTHLSRHLNLWTFRSRAIRMGATEEVGLVNNLYQQIQIKLEDNSQIRLISKFICQNMYISITSSVRR